MTDTAPWPDAETAQLRVLFAAGLSFGVIALEMKKTRNACVAKADRLGLPKRGKGSQPKVRKPPCNGWTGPADGTPRRRHDPSKNKRLLNMLERNDPGLADSLATPLIDDLAIPEAQKRRILELTEDTCRYPIGDPTDHDFYFCGSKPAPNSPYCADHHRRCRQPRSALRQIAVAE